HSDCGPLDSLLEERGEAEPGAVSAVEHAQAVGPDDAHAGPVDDLTQAGLARRGFLTGLVEAGAQDDQRTHALCRALLGCFEHHLARQRDHSAIDRIRYTAHGGPGSKSLHRLATWMDRVDRAGEIPLPNVE